MRTVAAALLLSASAVEATVCDEIVLRGSAAQRDNIERVKAVLDSDNKVQSFFCRDTDRTARFRELFKDAAFDSCQVLYETIYYVNYDHLCPDMPLTACPAYFMNDDSAQRFSAALDYRGRVREFFCQDPTLSLQNMYTGQTFRSCNDFSTAVRASFHSHYNVLCPAPTLNECPEKSFGAGQSLRVTLFAQRVRSFKCGSVDRTDHLLNTLDLTGAYIVGCDEFYNDFLDGVSYSQVCPPPTCDFTSPLGSAVFTRSATGKLNLVDLQCRGSPVSLEVIAKTNADPALAKISFSDCASVQQAIGNIGLSSLCSIAYSTPGTALNCVRPLLKASARGGFLTSMECSGAPLSVSALDLFNSRVAPEAALSCGTLLPLIYASGVKSNKAVFPEQCSVPFTCAAPAGTTGKRSYAVTLKEGQPVSYKCPGAAEKFDIPAYLIAHGSSYKNCAEVRRTFNNFLTQLC